MLPVEAPIVRPLGRVPELMVKAYGVCPPLTAMTLEYCAPAIGVDTVFETIVSVLVPAPTVPEKICVVDAPALSAT